jgi:pimeloyl-ACP methyl ester carboxylesterase
VDVGNQLQMPVAVIQQDWGAMLGYDATAVWKAWAPNLRHQTIDSGHSMAEEAPREISGAIRDLLER